MPSGRYKTQRYWRIDVTDEAVIKGFNYTEQINKRFQAPFGLKATVPDRKV